jgi:hypothetical protein
VAGGDRDRHRLSVVAGDDQATPEVEQIPVVSRVRLHTSSTDRAAPSGTARQPDQYTSVPPLDRRGEPPAAPAEARRARTAAIDVGEGVVKHSAARRNLVSTPVFATDER